VAGKYLYNSGQRVILDKYTTMDMTEEKEKKINTRKPIRATNATVIQHRGGNGMPE
jgi:hypothetical protein